MEKANDLLFVSKPQLIPDLSDVQVIDSVSLFFSSLSIMFFLRNSKLLENFVLFELKLVSAVGGERFFIFP